MIHIIRNGLGYLLLVSDQWHSYVSVMFVGCGCGAVDEEDKLAPVLG